MVAKDYKKVHFIRVHEKIEKLEKGNIHKKKKLQHFLNLELKFMLKRSHIITLHCLIKT